ncbi:unnamed protein product [Bursaphelenchus okinawaensis]|uniref:SGNH domain-containing protein n=1 Tax=Bursaphelenchus okinawaensis TaxID=465554 RepID=A0A811KD29_9BILA|nr:unnamed protein product [Bursaphelenchus okinawaensis]CAG9101301.1 unnamed protein product [Bursaphelenchus okinawaensis]
MIMYDAIRNATEPIDVLVVRFSYAYVLEQIPPNYDKALQNLQTFVGNVQEIANPKHLVISYNEYQKADLFEKVVRDVLKNSTESFEYDFRPLNSDSIFMNQVVSKIKCKNCIKVNFAEPLCNYITNKCMYALPNGLAIYRDFIHTTAFGSLYLADVLENQLKINNII